jgi:hypothetical protein
MRRKLYFEIVGPPIVEAPQGAPEAAPPGARLLSRLWPQE